MRCARQGGDARAQGVRQEFKALAAVLDRAPHEFAVLLNALAVRREYLNLEKCFLRARHAEDAHGTGQGGMGMFWHERERLHPETLKPQTPDPKP